MRPPHRPFAPSLGSDGIVRLVATQPAPFRPIQPHEPGAKLLPGGTKLEQEIVWVFPTLASVPLNPHQLRTHVRAAFQFFFGVAYHRAILNNVPLAENWTEAIPAVVNEVRTILKEGYEAAPNLETIRVVAGLERNIDHFGASSHWQLQSYFWGLGAEFMLAEQWGEVAHQSTSDVIRYSSGDELFAQEHEFVLSTIGPLEDVYIHAAYDIVALWNGAPTISQMQHSAARSERNQKLLAGTLATFSVVSEFRSNRAYQRHQGALTDLRQARADYLRRH